MLRATLFRATGIFAQAFLTVVLLLIVTSVFRASVGSAGDPEPLGDPPNFPPGDVNCDESVNIGDPIFLLDYLFSNGPAPAYCAGPADSIPPGTMMAFAGGDSQIPPGWLLCDGQSVSSTMYPDLFAVIGETHGDGGDGPGGDFDLPDYRGRFLRGVDGGAGRDPDASSRQAMNGGGSMGVAVGSVQDGATMEPNDAFATEVEGLHAHNIGAVPGHSHTIILNGDHQHTTPGGHSHGTAGSHDHTGSGTHVHGISGGTHFHGLSGNLTEFGSFFGDQDGAPKFINNSATTVTDNASHTHDINTAGSGHAHGSAGSHGHADAGNHGHGPGGNHDHAATSSSGHSHSADGSGDHSHLVIGGDAETRPLNAYVNWIIKH